MSPAQLRFMIQSQAMDPTVAAARRRTLASSIGVSGVSADAKATVYVVDDDTDDRWMAERLLRTLGYEPQSFANGDAFLAHVREHPGGCALLDMRMPGTSGLDVLRTIAAERLAVGTVVVTGHGELQLAVEAMKLGASDFIAKPYSSERIAPAVEACASLIAQRAAAGLDAHEARRRIALLSPREREVLDQLLEGHPTKMIAYHLGVSPRTVEVFRAKLMAKLEARSLAAVIRIALRAQEA